jgi:hypothetical protein
LRARKTFIVRADIAIGDQNVSDFTAIGRPLSGRSRHTKFYIIGMGVNEHSALGYVLVGHVSVIGNQ